jgi:hypothetical protein
MPPDVGASEYSTFSRQYLWTVHLLLPGVTIISALSRSFEDLDSRELYLVQAPARLHQTVASGQAGLHAGAGRSGFFQKLEGQDRPLIGQIATDSYICSSTSAIWRILCCLSVAARVACRGGVEADRSGSAHNVGKVASASSLVKS